MIRRRHLLQSAALLPGLLPALSAQRARAEDSVIKIGVIGALSGSTAESGLDVLLGAQIAADQLNAAGGIGGRRVEVLGRDDHGDPKATQTAFLDLVDNGVKLMAGGAITAPLLAVIPRLEAADASWLCCAAISMSLTHEAFSPRFFRLNGNAYMDYKGQARACAEHFPDATSWAIVASNVAFGHDIVNCFYNGLDEFYPKIAGKDVKLAAPIWAKYQAMDYKVQISSLLQTDVTGVYVGMVGEDAINFMVQAHQLGLDRKVRVLADPGLGFNLGKAAGNHMPESVLSYVAWYPGNYLDNPSAVALAREYEKRKNNPYVSSFVGMGNIAVNVYAQAILAAGTDKTGAVIAAIENGSFDTVNGKLRFRAEDHQGLPQINYMLMGNNPAEPAGWSVKQSLLLPGAELVEAASPGKEYVFPKTF